ncbi:unnamed protein product, partial [Allacma fusca]
ISSSYHLMSLQTTQSKNPSCRQNSPTRYFRIQSSAFLVSAVKRENAYTLPEMKSKSCGILYQIHPVKIVCLPPFRCLCKSKRNENNGNVGGGPRSAIPRLL